MTKVYITESGYKLNVASTLRMTASEAETLLDGVFEPALGNPDANGYVLSSTAAGVRSWVEGGGGASDVDDLATSTGSSTNMLRVAAAGGLEYRTAAQVLSDIGAAPTASPTFTGTVTAPTIVGGVIKPSSDSTTALKLTKTDGVTAVVAVDTTNSRVTVSGTSHVIGAQGVLDVSVSASGYPIRVAGSSSAAAFYVSTFAGLGTLGAYDWRFFVNNTSTIGVKIAATTGYFGAGLNNTSLTAYVDIAASTTAAASLRIRSGTAPTSPNDGDIWYDGSNLKIRIGATTYNVDVTAV